jgi:hypothetical protein
VVVVFIFSFLTGTIGRHRDEVSHVPATDVDHEISEDRQRPYKYATEP